LEKIAVSTTPGLQRIQTWPEESREAAKLVLEKYGEPDEASDTQLLWQNRGKWKRIVASKAFHRHEFPAPHIDSMECVIDYRVPVDKFTPLAKFDGSVIVECTAGEVSARCHDEEANFLALNLMHDIAAMRYWARRVRTGRSTRDQRHVQLCFGRRESRLPYSLRDCAAHVGASCAAPLGRIRQHE
jgi:hypothetical protein